MNQYDAYYYLSVQRTRAEHLDERNRFTTDPGAAAPVSPMYALTGDLQRLTRLSPIAAYHLPRVIATAAFPAFVVWFLGLCFPRRRDLVAWGAIFTLFVSGVLTFAPWVPAARRSSEWVVGATPLRSFTVFPHFAVAYVGLVLAYGAVAMAVRCGPVRAVAAVASAGGLLLGLSHTFKILPVAMVAPAFPLARFSGGCTPLARCRSSRSPASPQSSSRLGGYAARSCSAPSPSPTSH